MTKPSITIFGEGRVGTALSKSFKSAGFTMQSCFNSSSFPASYDDLGDLIFLTVPDGVIQELADKICNQFEDFEGKTIVHCSGTLSSKVFNSFEQKNANIGSFHPLKAVTHGQDSFENVWFDIEGDSTAVILLNEIAKAFNANSFEISIEAKPLLHAAAVVSSNYLVTLIQIAVQIAEVGGIDSKTAHQVLLPLAESTLNNINEKGIEASLTGPIARGDVDTLTKHQSVLKDQKSLLDIYNQLGELTVPLAKEIEESNKEEIEAMFKRKQD